VALNKEANDKAKYLYILEHCYEDEFGEHVKMIGLFTTLELAEKVQFMVADKPGFKDHPDGFSLTKIYLDHPTWLEGFGV
jgi:hypothetical protein